MYIANSLVYVKIMVASILTFIHLWKRKHSQQVVLFCVFMVTCIIGFVGKAPEWQV